jgi:cation diffusion facilitator family transporter
MSNILRIAAFSIIIGCVVLGLKFYADLLTGSVALLSDALESIVNVATAVAAAGALWISQKPADADHPYGHSKAEYFSAVFERVLIFVASISILREAYSGFLNPHPIDAPWTGLLVNALA